MNVSTTNMDKAAIGLSLACVVHCLLTPIAIVMLPALGSTFLDDELFHIGLLFLVLPISVFALGLGCRKHGNKAVLRTGVVGLAVLLSVVIIGEEAIGEIGERIATITGTAIIAYAHVRNYGLCRANECHDEHSACE